MEQTNSQLAIAHGCAAAGRRKSLAAHQSVASNRHIILWLGRALRALHFELWAPQLWLLPLLLGRWQGRFSLFRLLQWPCSLALLGLLLRLHHSSRKLISAMNNCRVNCTEKDKAVGEAGGDTCCRQERRRGGGTSGWSLADDTPE